MESNNQEEFYSWENVLAECGYRYPDISEDVIDKRMKRLVKLLTKEQRKELQVGRKYFFSEIEKEAMIFFVSEMKDKYLSAVLNNRSTAKTIEESCNKARIFRSKMLKKVEAIEDGRLQEMLIHLIEILCISELDNVRKEIMTNIKQIKDYIEQQPYEDKVKMLVVISDGIKKWISNKGI